ncbi:hypothetical protein AAZV13_16G081066 [Glycine max]
MTYINLDLECRVDKDADGRITEEEIKEVQYKIINSPLTVWPYFIWKKIDRQPGDALVAWTRGNYKRKKTDTQPWDEVLVAWGGQGRCFGAGFSCFLGVFPCY